jgi:predicted NBD/HSP70 family sugar kinase
MSRAELAYAAKISLPTLDRAVKDLRGQRLIDDTNGDEGGGSELRLGRHAGLVIGVDVGRAHQRAGLATAHGTLVGEPAEQDFSADPDRFSTALLNSIVERILAALEKGNEAVPDPAGRPYALSEIRAIGVGVPFPVSPNGTPVGLFAPDLSGLPLADIVKELLKGRAEELGTHIHPSLSVIFHKDADLGALALLRDDHADTNGSGPDPAAHEHLVFVKASYGIDAGIVCHGRLVRGARGLAGQVGHMWLPMIEDSFEPKLYEPPSRWPTEPCPRCDRLWCLENVASGRALLRDLESDGDESQTLPENVKSLVKYVTTEQLQRPASRKAVMRAGRTVGLVLADAVRLADPKKIVVGGLLALAGETFLEPLETAFSKAALPGLEPEIVGLEADRVTRIELDGAIALALKNVIATWA